MSAVNEIRLSNSTIGKGHPAFLVAEMSANHMHDLKRAIDIVHRAKECGANAIKLQTYTADTLTIDCDRDEFLVQETAWKGRRLYELYEEAHTPWEWHEELKQVAEGIGLVFFSTPFDKTAVDFLEKLNVPLYKLGSFELVDIPLIECIARTGKPMIMSTGMSTEIEIEEAVHAARSNGAGPLALLKCTSNYPAKYEDMNLKAITGLSQRFDVIPGISDHTPGGVIPCAAVTLGACIVEKHFTLDVADGAVDSFFSLDPKEFKSMVDAVRLTERALGKALYQPTESEKKNMMFRKSIFSITDIDRGTVITEKHIKVIRPGHGLPPKHYKTLIGKRALLDIQYGTPLSMDMFGEIV